MAEEELWEGLCLRPSRSDWPVFHYDGRWYCSRSTGHDGDCEARERHDPVGEVAWTGPWVPDGEVKCSLHGKTDCSPLLNGCTELTSRTAHG